MRAQVIWATVVLALLTSQAAVAELRFCNKTPLRLYTAVGFQGTDDEWYAKGWWPLWPEECATVVPGELDGRYYYGYAFAGTRSWNGEDNFCTSPDAFRVRNREICPQGSHDFFEIDTGDRTEWTQRLTCRECDARPEIRYDDSSHSIDASHLTSIVTQGVKVFLPVEGHFSLATTDSSLAIDVRLTADLEHLQQKIGAILSKSVDKSEECGDRIHTYGASLQPRGSQAVFTSRVRYEKWNCTSMDLPQVKCEDTWIRVGPLKTKGIPKCRTWIDTTRTSKTKLFQQSGTVRIALSPLVTGRDTIRMQAKVESVDLDGLGDFVADLLHLDLKDRAQAELSRAVNGAKLALTVPTELQPYFGVFAAEFFGVGSSLRLRAVGRFEVTSADVKPLCRRLFDPDECDVLKGE